MQESTLLSIKEFSDLTGVNQSTLRYYDEIGILPAASRGENNYRYYMPFQIIKLNYISVLVDLGVPLSVIKNMNRDRTPESVIDLLDRQESILNRKLNALQKAYSLMHIYRKNIQAGLMAEPGIIRVEELEETPLVLGEINDPKFKSDETFYEEFIRFCKSANNIRVNLSYPIGGRHESMESFLSAPNRPDRWFSLDPLGNYTCPAKKHLVAYIKGYYGEFGDIAQRMVEYAKEHDLVFKGPVYVLYLLDEVSIVEPDQYLSRISVSVSEKNKIKRVKK